ncbi:MAG: glycosyltransferase family 4 protein [Cytophagales bacterium]|nr:glycosyltransferase family 4 protein [Cytophagales bacterium]
MKRLFYFHQYFKIPEEGGAMRSYFIAKGMVDHGIQVEMITAHNNSHYEIRKIDGIKVHFLPVYYSNDLSARQRFISFAKFVLKSIKTANRLRRPDLIYATSTPLTVGIISLWYKWRWKIPYIFEVRDLWPDAPIQLNFLKSRLLIAIARKLEKKIYRNSSVIVALSPGIERGILSSYNRANIHMIPNMSDPFLYQTGQFSASEKKRITLGYFGAMGVANRVEFILEIAEKCQFHKLDVDFVIVGDGARKKEMEVRTSKMNLENVRICSFKNRYEIRELMCEVDGCITCFANIPVLQTNSPNKFFDGLAAGKLSIVNTKGWLKELVEKYDCGFYVDPDFPGEFPKMIRPFIEEKELLQSKQQNARNLAKEMFDKDDLVHKICALVLNN